MNADVEQEGIIIEDYDIGMVCSDKSSFHLRDADGRL